MPDLGMDTSLFVHWRMCTSEWQLAQPSSPSSSTARAFPSFFIEKFRALLRSRFTTFVYKWVWIHTHAHLLSGNPRGRWVPSPSKPSHLQCLWPQHLCPVLATCPVSHSLALSYLHPSRSMVTATFLSTFRCAQIFPIWGSLLHLYYDVIWEIF